MVKLGKRWGLFADIMLTIGITGTVLIIGIALTILLYKPLPQHVDQYVKYYNKVINYTKK